MRKPNVRIQIGDQVFHVGRQGVASNNPLTVAEALKLVEFAKTMGKI